MVAKKKTLGRPTDYNPKYCADIVNFFLNHIIDRDKPDYPTITDFARKYNITRSSINLWATKYPDFSEALKQIKELQKEIIIKGAITGVFNASFSIFAMKNIAGWRDKTDIEHSGSITWEGLVNDLRVVETRMAGASKN